ncbi:MAG: hypothetical protein ACO20F_06085 [Robiginitalea sp.]|jgi:hypothetical protein
MKRKFLLWVWEVLKGIEIISRLPHQGKLGHLYKESSNTRGAGLKYSFETIGITFELYSY